MKHWLKLTFLSVALGSLGACSSLAQIDREYLNHSSLDLAKYEAQKTPAPLSQLSGVGAGGASAGCSVCAH